MKAPDFRYERPASLSEALALLAEEDATPIAGGQSLMPMMNFRIAAPALLVDLNGLADLAGITAADGWLTIGAMTRYAALEGSAQVMEGVPLMARALPHIAHPAIRNRGTLGGSLALADPAAEMPAVLLALGGEVVVQGPGGPRTIAADDWATGLYETARAPGELVTAIRVPLAAPGQRFGFHELARRHGDYAMAGVCIAATGHAVRVAFFAISDRPLRAPGAEAALATGDIDAAVAALADLPIDGDLHAGPDTKRHLAGVALRRAWAEATS